MQPGVTQEPARRHPGAAEKALRRNLADAQEAPRRHPRGSQAPSGKHLEVRYQKKYLSLDRNAKVLSKFQFHEDDTIGYVFIFTATSAPWQTDVLGQGSWPLYPTARTHTDKAVWGTNCCIDTVHMTFPSKRM